MRTLQRNAIVALDTHMARLVKSISSIHFEGKTEAETRDAHECLSSLRDPVLLEQKIVPLLGKGLKAYYEQVDDTTHSDHPSEAKVSILATYSFKVSIPFPSTIFLLTFPLRRMNLILQHI